MWRSHLSYIPPIYLIFKTIFITCHNVFSRAVELFFLYKYKSRFNQNYKSPPSMWRTHVFSELCLPRVGQLRRPVRESLLFPFSKSNALKKHSQNLMLWKTFSKFNALKEEEEKVSALSMVNPHQPSYKSYGTTLRK